MDNPFTSLLELLEKIDNSQKRIEAALSDLKMPTTYVNDKVKIKEACEITGYTEGYIYQLVTQKSIPFFRVGRALRFSRSELKVWIEAGRPSIFKATIDHLSADHIVNGIKGFEAKNAS